ncbi:hypothetical protein [Hymenobacter volaticus]|uniref:Uncharacterized protein n=1 Tax=Hymenobacter volaticus TaxID=2932254 RepID=A0ABY4GCM0_9BACT|nr:hypothetical protein [Hymenobacter volaticus]UOQ68597.1 hypothetical protein MUN86_24135 [Hymenobacter volaticus]
MEWDTRSSEGKISKLKDAAGKDMPEHNWVWSPQGVVNMHYPERWGYLQFSRQVNTVFRLPYAELQKRYLWLVYYRQKQYREKFGRYATTLAELKITSQVTLENQVNQLQLEATPRQFTATITAPNTPAIRLNDEGLLTYTKP